MIVSYENERVRQEVLALLDPDLKTPDRFHALRRLRNRGLVDDHLKLTEKGREAAALLADIIIERFTEAQQ